MLVATKIRKYANAGMKGSSILSSEKTPIRRNVSARKSGNTVSAKCAASTKNAGFYIKANPKAPPQTRDANNGTSNNSSKNRVTKVGRSPSMGRNASSSTERGRNTAHSPSMKREGAPSSAPQRNGAKLTHVKPDSPPRKNVANASSGKRNNTPSSPSSGGRVDSPRSQANSSSRGRHGARAAPTERVQRLRSLSPSRKGEMGRSPHRERIMKGMASTKRIRSLSPTNRGDRVRQPNNGSSEKYLTPEKNEKSSRVKILMASHKLLVLWDPDFPDEVEIFEEPMLRHVKLDDDLNERSQLYGDLTHQIQDRTARGFNAFLDGDFDVAYHQYSIVNDLKWEHYVDTHERAVDSIIRMSMILEAQGRMKSAILQKTGALDLYRSLRVSKIKVIDTLTSVGNSHFFQEKYKDALIVYKEALRKIKKYSPAAKDKIANIKIKIGRTYAELGKSSDAMNTFEDALQLQQCSATASDMDIAQTLVEIGDVYLFINGKRDASTKAYTEALRIYRSNNVRYDDPRMAGLLNRLDATVPSCDARTSRTTGDKGAFNGFDSCTSVGMLAGAAGMDILALSRGGLTMVRDTSSEAVNKFNEFMMFESCGKDENENNQDDKKEENHQEDRKEENNQENIEVKNREDKEDNNQED